LRLGIENLLGLLSRRGLRSSHCERREEKKEKKKKRKEKDGVEVRKGEAS